MSLLVGGHSIPVAQMGPDFVLLQNPVNHPPADASVVLQVDKSERSWNVHLPHGMSAHVKRVTIAARV